MRRAAAVVLGTLTGTALMVGAKIGNATPGDDPALAGDGGVVVGGANPAGPGVAVSGGARTPTPGKSPTPGGKTPTGGPTTKAPTGAPTTPGRTPAPTTTTPKPPPTTPPPSGPKDGTYQAQAQVRGGRYGTLSMSVTISGGRITAISASEDGGETNCYHSACNTLKPEALSAQSANVASVSRATYTSSAFKSALAAILNTANA